ncbi:MAG: carbohydrate kinase family protein [Chloroflexi bacterium]|nr:carbohydrate kinase family protein [Chloroflexota bacterium]
MTLDRAPRIACVGLSSWDRLISVSEYPAVGEQADVLEEVSAPGGTTTNTAVALARLGARVGIATAIGDDERGTLVRRSLENEGVETGWLAVKPGEITDLATVIVSQQPLERTIFWEQGAQLVRGDQLDIAGLFGGDVLVVDVADVPLRRFLLDLPAHTVPTARILGPLTYLAHRNLPDAFDLALRHDAIVSNERDLLDVTGTWTLSDAVKALQHRMRGATLRAALITRGAEGCRVVTETESVNVPAYLVDVVDPTGAGDAFVAGVAWGMAQRWPWLDVGRFANALGAMACCSLGAQASLPTLEEVETLLATGPATGD